MRLPNNVADGHATIPNMPDRVLYCDELVEDEASHLLHTEYDHVGSHKDTHTHNNNNNNNNNDNDNDNDNDNNNKNNNHDDDDNNNNNDITSGQLAQVRLDLPGQRSVSARVPTNVLVLNYYPYIQL